MAGTTHIRKVHYHFESTKGGSGQTGGKISPEYIDYVSVASDDYNSIKTVLSNNSKLLGGGTLVIDASIAGSPSGSETILT